MKKAAIALFLVVTSIALVACGGSSSSSSSSETSESTAAESGSGGAEGNSGGGSGGTVEFETNPNGNLEYTTTTATAKAGKVTVDFTNPQPLGHDVAIENSAGETVGQTEIVEEGSDSTTVNLKPGTYHFFCTVPGHRQAGMEGTLTVK
jgi:plastocyanin